MSAELTMAKLRLFNRDGLSLTNIKLFPGSNRNVTAEQIAAELNKSLFDLEAESVDSLARNPG